MLEEIEGRKRREWQRMRWSGGITNSMDVSLSKLRDSEEKGSLTCCSPWSPKELDMTWQLNNNNINALKNNLCLHVFFSNLCVVYRMLLGNMLDACFCLPAPAKRIYFGGGVKICINF